MQRTTARRAPFALMAAAAVTCTLLMAGTALARDEAIQQVSFPSEDGHTRLVGYLFTPDRPSGRGPAIVLMHGRSGAYTKAADGDYSARTLRRRDESWARILARQRLRSADRRQFRTARLSCRVCRRNL